MIKKYLKLIGITCLDFFIIIALIPILPGFIGDFILELKNSLGIIDRVTSSSPLIAGAQVLLLLILIYLVIYLNINEYKKSKK